METLKQHLKDSVNSFFILLFFTVLLANCKQTPQFGSIDEYHPHGRGFTLQRFDVVSSQFESIVREYKNKYCRDDNIITVLYLNWNDSKEIMVGMTSLDKRYDTLSKRYIFGPHNRIIGFTAVESDTLIVLSNIERIVDFGVNAYKFVRPTNDKQYFDYIYFPDDLYCLTDENGIPCPPLIYTPYYNWYHYKNNEFHFYDESEYDYLQGYRNP